MESLCWARLEKKHTSTHTRTRRPTKLAKMLSDKTRSEILYPNALARAISVALRVEKNQNEAHLAEQTLNVN